MPLKSYAIVALLLATFGAGWGVNGWRLGAQLDAQAAKYDKANLARVSATLAQAKAARVTEDALRGELVDIDRTRTLEQRKAKNEIDTLRASLARGSMGLRVAATCPDAGPGIVPGAADRSGVDTGTAPRLTADAESAYIALREGIEAQRVQLGACVSTLERITKP